MGSYWVVYVPILERIARLQPGNHGSNDPCTRTTIIDHGNPDALHGTSATAHVMTIACANDAKILDRLLGALNSHEFVLR